MAQTLFLAAVLAAPPAELISRVWLTPRSADVMSVGWTSPSPGPSVVEHGPDAQLGRAARVDGDRTLHHVRIPCDGRRVYYRVRSGDAASEVRSFRPLADVGGDLRLAVVANWHMTAARKDPPDLSALRADDPHLLLTAGDNVGSFWGDCGRTTAGCLKPYAALFDAYPGLFANTPFLPVSGNHDREVRGRGKTRPPASDPVYDVEAATFRRVFDGPGRGLFWRLDLPGHGLRVVAADLHHTSDVGTGWQSGLPFGEDSPQLAAFERWTTDAPPRTLALFNEQASTVRRLAGGRWGDALARVPLAVTGFGHFAERSQVGPTAFVNTSLAGRGDRYPDPRSRWLASEDTYLLVTVPASGPMRADIKSLDGRVLHTFAVPGDASPSD